MSVAAAVVVAAAGAASASWVIQDQRVRDEQAKVQAARADENLTRAVLASADLVTREAPLDGGGRVTVAYSRTRDAGIIMLAADAAPPAGKVYQLWTITGTTATDRGALAAGQTSAVTLVHGLPSAEKVGISMESAPSASQPTRVVGGVALT